MGVSEDLSKSNLDRQSSQRTMQSENDVSDVHSTYEQQNYDSYYAAPDFNDQNIFTHCRLCGTEIPGYGYDTNEELKTGGGLDRLHPCTCRKTTELKKTFNNINRTLDDLIDSIDSSYDSYLKASNGDQTHATKVADAKDILKDMAACVFNTRTLNTTWTKIQAASKTEMKAIELLLRSSKLSQREGELMRDMKSSLQLSNVELEKKIQLLSKYHERCMNIQDFEFIRQVGQGGFSTVFLSTLAYRSTKPPYYAIKVIQKDTSSDPKAAKSLEQELKAMQYTNTYPKYFVGLKCSFITKEAMYFVMEYLPGGNCLSLLNTVGLLSWEVASHVVAQVCVAISHLHRHGLVHRDIKPDNILISNRGHVKLGDFGSIGFYRPNTVLQTEKNDKHGDGNKDEPLGGGEEGTLAMSNPAALGIQSSAKTEQNSNDRIAEKSSKSSKELSGLSVQDSVSSNLWNLAMKSDSKDSNNGESKSESCSVEDGQSGVSNDTSSSGVSLSFRAAGATDMMHSIAGFFQYATPEAVLGKPYDHTVDWWATGVLLFHLMKGYMPFQGHDKETTLMNILEIRINWEEDSLGPSSISEACRDYIISQLDFSPKKRLGYISSKKVLGHRFFSNIDFEDLYNGNGPYLPVTKHATEMLSLTPRTPGDSRKIKEQLPEVLLNEISEGRKNHNQDENDLSPQKVEEYYKGRKFTTLYISQ